MNPTPTDLRTWRARPILDPARWQHEWDMYEYKNVASEHAYQLDQFEALQRAWRRKLHAARDSERRRQLSGQAA